MSLIDNTFCYAIIIPWLRELINHMLREEKEPMGSLQEREKEAGKAFLQEEEKRAAIELQFDSLKKRRDIETVLSCGQKLRRPLFSAYYNKIEFDGMHRIAFIVSKKIEKSAVKRNRIKRRIKEAIRKSPNKKCGKSIEMVIFPRKACLIEKTKTIEREIEMLLNRIC